MVSFKKTLHTYIHTYIHIDTHTYLYIYIDTYTSKYTYNITHKRTFTYNIHRYTSCHHLDFVPIILSQCSDPPNLCSGGQLQLLAALLRGTALRCQHVEAQLPRRSGQWSPGKRRHLGCWDVSDL